MKQTLLLLTFVLSFYSQLKAQIPDWDWAVSAGGTGDDKVLDVCSDGNGNTYITGSFTSPTISFGSTILTNHGNTDFFLVKYDILGNPDWAISAGGTGADESFSISTDAFGDIYVIGHSKSSPLTIENTTLLIAEQSAFLLKFNTFGNLLWAKSYYGADPYFSNYSIINDINNNVCITGTFSAATINFDNIALTKTSPFSSTADVFIVKINPLGEVIWAKSGGGVNDDHSGSISTDALGNIYILGNSNSTTFNFDLITLQNNYNNDAVFLTKYDPSGNVLWARLGNGINNIEGTNITTDNNGDVVITGDFYGPSVYFGTDTLINPLTNITNLFLVKYDAFGNVLWTTSTNSQGHNYGRDISIDNNNNIYLTGEISSQTIFGSVSLDLVNNGYNDLFVVKYDKFGNDIMGTIIGGTLSNISSGIFTDNIGNMFVTGNFQTPILNVGATSLSNIGGYDMMLAKFKTKGVFGRIFNDINENCLLDVNEFNLKGRTATINPGNISIETGLTGTWFLDSLQLGSYTISYDTSYKWNPTCPTIQNFIVTNIDSILQIPSFGLKANFGFAKGIMFHDFNTNCEKDTNEQINPSRLGLINPGNIIVESNSIGLWATDTLDIGSYTLTIDTSNYWKPSCQSILNFDITPFGLIDTSYLLGFISTRPCSSPTINIEMPSIRPCFSNQRIYIQACNTSLATNPINNGYVILKLDSLLTPNSSSIPFSILGNNNSYSFDIGTLNPNECINFWVDTDVSCNAILGQTVCMQANLYPADSCVFDTIPTPIIGGTHPCTLPWDKSSLSVSGWCQNDSIYFSVTNNGAFGNGDMQCYAPVRIYIDGVLTTIDSVLLVGGQTQFFIFEADGRTWRLEADQHPLHPGNSHPNATVELCGNIANWTPNLINISPQNDADPVVDIYCGVVTGSYDPNDKTGYPLGVGNDHFVAPNGKIDYVIRFQNTGTDTAFTVVVRDTLDVDFDIFSVQSGVSSHNYTFKMYGPRVLEWTFNNILLPDSTTDEPASNGFITFTVNQNPNLPDGTVINNSVGIYFDFNEPVITNTTNHTINRGINYLLTVNNINQPNNNSLFIYPNPTKNLLNIVVPDVQSLKIEIYTIDGKLIEQKNINQNIAIDVSKYQSGLYFIHATNSKGEVFRNKFVKE